MERRSLIAAATALFFCPTVSASVGTRSSQSELPAEDCRFWWSHVQHAIILDTPKYCTEAYLDMVVKRSSLNHLSDAEAKQIIQRAFEGKYALADIPEEYLQKPVIAMPEDIDRFNRLLGESS